MTDAVPERGTRFPTDKGTFFLTNNGVLFEKSRPEV